MNEITSQFFSKPSGLMLSFILGLIFGSFANVLIWRLPRNESPIFGRSKCPKCGKKIPWYQNIPLISYIFLLGKCSFCKKPISPQYFIVELVTGFIFIYLFLRFGFKLSFLLYGLFLWILFTASIIDIHHRIIPDELSISGLIIGLGASFILVEIEPLDSLLGILVGGGIFFFIAYAYEKITHREGLGGGDVKLLAMIGAWLGVKSILIVIILSTALGSLVGLLIMFLKKKDFKTAIPFGPFLAIGAALYFIYEKKLLGFFFPTFY